MVIFALGLVIAVLHLLWTLNIQILLFSSIFENRFVLSEILKTQKRYLFITLVHMDSYVSFFFLNSIPIAEHHKLNKNFLEMQKGSSSLVCLAFGSWTNVSNVTDCSSNLLRILMWSPLDILLTYYFVSSTSTVLFSE